jgi:hypothetical protein
VDKELFQEVPETRRSDYSMNSIKIKITIGLAATFGLSGLGALAVPAAQASTAHSAAATTTTTLAPPVQGAGKHWVFLYVDTVTGGGTPTPAAGCAQTNYFLRGQVVVFRMDGVNVVAGGVALTSANTQSAVVKIPGVAPLSMTYGSHGKASFWTVPWTVPATYPLGIVDFSVRVSTDPVPATPGHARVSRVVGVFTQIGLAPPSRLTIVAAAPSATTTTAAP